MTERPSDESIAVTNAEDRSRKHLVQPYQERPVVELRPGTVACPYCGNPHFRRSRPRLGDLFELLLLRYPVRCTRCSQRQFVEISIAMLSYPPRHIGPRTSQGSDTWKSWTEPSATVQVARPLSTALGPKARNLDPISKTHRVAPPPRIPSRREDDSGIW